MKESTMQFLLALYKDALWCFGVSEVPCAYSVSIGNDISATALRLRGRVKVVWAYQIPIEAIRDMDAILLRIVEALDDRSGYVVVKAFDLDNVFGILNRTFNECRTVECYLDAFGFGVAVFECVNKKDEVKKELETTERIPLPIATIKRRLARFELAKFFTQLKSAITGIVGL